MERIRSIRRRVSGWIAVASGRDVTVPALAFVLALASVTSASPVDAESEFGVRGIGFGGDGSGAGGVERMTPQERQRSWERASGVLGELRRERRGSGFSAKVDGEAWNERLDSLLDEAVERLASSDLKDARKKLDRIRRRRSEIRDEISRLRIERASAPKRKQGGGLLDAVLSPVRSLVNPTRADYTQRIEEKRAELKRLGKRADEIRARFVEELRAAGVDITKKQAEGLLAMATAEEVVDIVAVFRNMKAINAELLERLKASGESLESSRRYYGLHAVMLETALFAHEAFIRRVEERYMKRLDAIAKRARRLREEARSMRRGDDMDEVLRKNIRAQDMTLKAVSAYRKQLARQVSRVRESAEDLRRRVRIARNTWRTVETSSQLVDMMRAGGRSFRELMSMEIPKLRPFESIRLEREFREITRQIDEPTS